jgi:hypothetical protein
MVKEVRVLNLRVTAAFSKARSTDKKGCLKRRPFFIARPVQIHIGLIDLTFQTDTFQIRSIPGQQNPPYILLCSRYPKLYPDRTVISLA